MFGKLFHRLFAQTKRSAPPQRRLRLELEVLEARVVPTQFVWTNASHDGMASTAANWYDPVGGTHFVPGSGDDAIFGDGGLGSDTACTVDMASWDVNSVVMDSSYGAIFSVPDGNEVSTANQFVQYGGLVLTGTAEIDAGTSFYINGAVSTAGSNTDTAVLSTTGSFYLNASGTVTASGFMAALKIDTGGFDDGGTINVGDGMTGAMTIDGSFDQLSAAVTNIVFGSTLTFTDADPDIQGTLNLNGTVSSDTAIAIDGGTLNSAAGVTNAIVGSIGVYNGGVINVGTSSTDGSGAGTLTQTSGDFFVIGSKEADLPPTGGTLNLYTGSALTFPAATGSTEVVVTAGGVVNMYGAGIAMATSRVADLQLDTGEETMAAAVLYSYSNIMGSPTNTISGNVDNNGLIAFQGLLNGLAITANPDSTGGNYTQESEGTLSMRLDNGPADDGLAVAGTATLGGTLTLSALNDLTANQKWTLIGAGNISGDFATINWPDSSPSWATIIAATTYKVGN